MAQTGQPGGRQGLDNNRESGPIHAKPPAVEQAPQADLIANAKVLHGTPNTNRIQGPIHVHPPVVQKTVPASGTVKTPQGSPNTNVYRKA